jgi:hypothetical protein
VSNQDGGGGPDAAPTVTCRSCAGCNTRWVDTGCDDDRYHEGCPHPCAVCGKPITGRDGPNACAGHSLDEAMALNARIREMAP